MRLLSSFFAISILLSACTTSTTVVNETSIDPSVIYTGIKDYVTCKDKKYPKYNPPKSWEEFMGENYKKELPNSKSLPHRIAIEGEIATAIHQHMMKVSMESNDEHLYIDVLDSEGQQLVGYYNPTTIGIVPDDTKRHYFLGTLHSISGAGKGGGTHTEWYIDLDRIE